MADRTETQPCAPMVVHRFRIIGTTYRCRIHPVRCAEEGCTECTPVRPFCSRHARMRMGVELRRVRLPSRIGSCGLFSVWSFATGDLICPYLGRRTPKDRWHCPLSSGTAEDSGYAVAMSESEGNGQYEASCERSYAAMSNHADPGIANAALVYLTADSARRIREARTCRYGCFAAVLDDEGIPILRIPSVFLLGSAAPDDETAADRRGLVAGAVWLQAIRAIPPDTEIRVDYGPEADELINVRSRTTPPLCS